MKLSFKRITSSGSFIPEIDGLRFIAITSVVLYHITGYLMTKKGQNSEYSSYYLFLKQMFSNGHLGVPLFFVISGFILAMPFAKHYLKENKPVNLRNYFIRRLTRLEPPYVLVMTILLFGAVYIAKNITLGDGLISYLSSITYCHNFIYGKDVLPLLNGVTWSLEIEVQFYILAPVLAYMFALKSSLLRRTLIFGIAILFLILNSFIDLPFRSLVGYIQYFLIGFLLADLYISKSEILPKTKFDIGIGLFFFSIIWFFDESDFKSNFQKGSWELVQLIGIFFFYYYVLFHKILKFLSYRVITNIGGMCYSIYLVHYPIISMFGSNILKLSFSKHEIINVLMYPFLLIIAVMSISSVFFLCVERPCMDKDWYKKLFRKRFSER
ncbi:acyltransferase [Pedobacter nutrimenti]|uniref:acyltransferase family protein n=1 Tax=Pedobacter nutrimenti TaxID=1241337 RepID=UPI0029314D03|nr:acyltransferase [Pedobacter nutrimenti]